MKISKDLYEYLAGFADDKTIVKMLSVNNKFNDPVFFQRIFNRKYPLLIKFKKDNQNWKDFYLSMVKYISKLEEEFDIPYIPSKNYNPKDFYYNHEEDIYNDAMEWAVDGTDLEIVKLLIEKGAGVNTAMYNAATSSEKNVEIVKLLIEKGADDFNEAMLRAALVGNVEMVKLLIKKGANNFNDVKYHALVMGSMKIVELLENNIF